MRVWQDKRGNYWYTWLAEEFETDINLSPCLHFGNSPEESAFRFIQTLDKRIKDKVVEINRIN